MKEYRLLPILLVLLLTACAAEPTPSPSPASTVSLTSSPTVTLTPTATGTAICTPSPTATLTPTPTNTATPTPRYVPPPGLNRVMGLPLGATARLGRGQFNDVELSENGAYLAVSSSVGIAVYDALTFQELWFEVTQNGMGNLYISPDNTMIAGSEAGSIYVWDLVTGNLLHILKDLNAGAYTIAWSPDSKRIFAGLTFGNPYAGAVGDVPEGPYNTMAIWDVESGSVIHNLRIENESEIFETETFQHYSPDYDRLPMLESEWSADGKYLVVGVSFEGYGANSWYYPGILLIMWNTESGEEIGYFEWNTPATANRQEAAKDRISIHPEQHILATSSDGGLLFVDLETGRPIESFLETNKDIIFTGVGWSPNGSQLLTTSHEIFNESPGWLTRPDTLRVWDIETGENTQAIARADLAPDTYDSTLTDFEWSPAGSEVAAAYLDDRVIVWDAATGEERISFEQVGEQIRWLPDGEGLLTISDYAIHVWDTKTGELKRSLKADHIFQDVAWSPDGQTLVIASEYVLNFPQYHHEALVEFWNPATGQPGLTLSTNDPEREHIIRRVVFSPDGKLLAASEGPYSSGNVHVWDAVTGERVFEDQVTNDNIHVWDVAWSPDQSMLALAGEDFTRLHNGQTGEFIKSLYQLSYTLAWSPDSKTLAAWLPDGAVRLVDVETEETVFEFDQLNFVANSIAWSPDGARIAIGTGRDRQDGETGMIYIFDSNTGEQLALLKNLEPPPEPFWFKKADYPVTDVVWLTDEIIAVSHGASPMRMYRTPFDWVGGIITIWNTQTGEMLLELDGHNEDIQALDLSPDGSTLASASADGTVILWDVAQIMAMIGE